MLNQNFLLADDVIWYHHDIYYFSLLYLKEVVVLEVQ